MTPEQKEQNYERAKVLLSEQNYQAALISGLIATILAAGIYAVIAVVAGYSVSYMAIALGAFVGFTIQFLGRGIESRYAVLASILAVFGCVLGNFFAGLILLARNYGESASDIASQITFQSLVDSTVSGFRPLTILFWLLAVAAASYFAKRRLSREDGLAIYTYEHRPKDGELVT
jgi:phosphate/sulfate permease